LELSQDDFGRGIETAFRARERIGSDCRARARIVSGSVRKRGVPLQFAVMNTEAGRQGRVRFGSAGLGGYADTVLTALLETSRAPGSGVQLAAVCEPDLAKHAARAGELRGMGVRVLRTYEELLREPIDAVWLPVPIQLHRPFMEMALKAGKAVICEKPAAGCIDDVEAMVGAERDAGLPAAIGFQDIYTPEIQGIKRRLSTGELGKVVRASVVGCWPRGSRYFERNDWAGRMKRGDAWVLDSPANNALAHYVHLALFLMGGGPFETAEPAAVEAELYRAGEIENYDTCSLRVRTVEGATLMVLLTHACEHSVGPIVTVETDAGARIVYTAQQPIRVHAPDGRVETVEQSAHKLQCVLDGFVRRLRGDAAAPVSTVAMSRAHARVISGASEASPVVSIPPAHLTAHASVGGGDHRVIAGIEETMKHCAAAGQMLHESGRAPWSVPPRQMSLLGYRTFRGPAQA
jgi:predicted dehydrogenase